MLFDSGVFLVFFAAFLPAYWLVRGSLHRRNVLILGASFLFYGWWDWRFLALLIGSSSLDYWVGRLLMRTDDPRRRKMLVTLSIVGNLAVLGFFKYWGFFATSLSIAMGRLGFSMHVPTLEIVLPVGISFYTFQAMSYAIDVYRREIPATKSLLHFLAYVSFFPQLVAGPIERGRRLLPQIESPRVVTQSMVEEGVWLMVQGLFKKVVLAGNLAPLADLVFGSATFTAPAVILGTVAFGLQIYADFSGYSDIARGTARVLGFELMANFHIPYAATSLREFWQRWHISLSTWLRDYLYVSLGGNRHGRVRTCLNLAITMLLGGLWHGAAWNFVLWGAWHALGLVVARCAVGFPRVGREGVATAGAKGQPRGRLRTGISWGITMGFVFYGWLLFRARSFAAILDMTAALARWELPAWTTAFALNLLAFGVPLVALDFWQQRAGVERVIPRGPAWLRAAVMGGFLAGTVVFWKQHPEPFIYFRF